MEQGRWRGLAETYDRNALHTSAPWFAEEIATLVRQGETVLEIGPGTGGFTVPVARRASRVLAVDLSDAMLAVLGESLAGPRLANVECVQGDWPNVEVPVHDVALAVNSLYRVLDIRTTIERLSAAARRLVVVAWSIGHNPPVLPSIVDPAGPRRYRPGVTYIHLLLALHELGIPAALSIRPVPRLVWRASYDEATDRLLGGVLDPTEEERGAARALARAWFQPEDGGVVHRYMGSVAVIQWPGQAAT